MLRGRVVVDSRVGWMFEVWDFLFAEAYRVAARGRVELRVR